MSKVYISFLVCIFLVGENGSVLGIGEDKANSVLHPLEGEKRGVTQQASRKSPQKLDEPARDSQVENGRLCVGGFILPYETLLHIFSFLDPQEKGNAREVCKLWGRLIADDDWDKLGQFVRGEYDPKALAGLLRVMPEKFSFVLNNAHHFFHREGVKKYIPLFFTPETYPTLVEDGLAFAELFPELQVYVQGNPGVQKFLREVLEQSNISPETIKARMKDVKEHASLKKGLGALYLLERVQPRIANLPCLYHVFLSYWDLKKTPTGNVMWCGYFENGQFWKDQLNVISGEPRHFRFLESVIRAVLKRFPDSLRNNYSSSFTIFHRTILQCCHGLLDSYTEHRLFLRAYEFLENYVPQSLAPYCSLLDRIQVYMLESKGEEDFVELRDKVCKKIEILLFNQFYYISFPVEERSLLQDAALALMRVYCQLGDYDKALEVAMKYFRDGLKGYTIFLEALSDALPEALMDAQRKDAALLIVNSVRERVEYLVQKKEAALTAAYLKQVDIENCLNPKIRFTLEVLRSAKLTLMYVYHLRGMTEEARAFSAQYLPQDKEFCRRLEEICPVVRESLVSIQPVGPVTDGMVEAQERSLFSQSELSSLRPAALALMRTYCQRGEFKKAHAFLDEYFGRDDLEAYTEFLDASFPAVVARKEVFGRQRLEYKFPMTEQTVLFRSAEVIRKALSKETGHSPTLLAKARKVLSRFYFTFVSLDQLAATCNSYILDVLDLGDKDQ